MKLKLDSDWQRAPVWIGMAGVIAASWTYLIRMGADMSAMDTARSAHGAAMAGNPSAQLAMVFAMWAVMMVAMMLPTVTPSAVLFSRLSAKRDPAHIKRATSLYVGAYAACWVGFAAPAAVLQWTLTNSLLLDESSARSTSTWLSAAILIGAGFYQFSPLKNACLSKCRTPLGFFMAEWRDGSTGALMLGLRHGGYCVACCWALMAVMFVVGAMNLAWMGLLTLVVLGEKIFPPAWRFDRVVGMTLVGSGLWLAAGATLGS